MRQVDEFLFPTRQAQVCVCVCVRQSDGFICMRAASHRVFLTRIGSSESSGMLAWLFAPFFVLTSTGNRQEVAEDNANDA